MRILIPFSLACALLGAGLVLLLSQRATPALDSEHEASASAANFALLRREAEPPAISSSPEGSAGEPASDPGQRVETSEASSSASDVPEDPETAVQWASSALGRTIDPRRRRLLQQLDRALRQLADEPRHPGALRDAISACSGLGRWEAAARYLRLRVEIEPDDPELRVEHAAALMRLSRWTEAVWTLEAALEVAPHHGEVWHNLAVAHQSLGRLADARVAWDRVIALRERDADALAHRAEVLMDLGDYAAAAADCARALALDVQADDVALNEAKALELLGDLPGAHRALTRFVARRPRHVVGLSRLAELAWGLYLRDPDTHAAQREEALDCCKRILETGGDQPEIRKLFETVRRAGD
jgi:tetratricopeptide (TPR) repeat protein